MFVPSTRNGVLIKALKEAETEMSKMTRFHVRYQEAGGIQLARLFSTDLGKGCHVGDKSDTLEEDMEKMKRYQTANKPTLFMSQVARSATKRMEIRKRMRRKKEMESIWVKLRGHYMKGPGNILRMPLTSVKAVTW